MHNYKKILVAIDFSDYGNLVAKQARYIADTFRAELHVIHVLDNIPMPDTPYGTLIPLDGPSDDLLLQTEKNKFIQICDAVQIIPANRWLIWGVPQEEITRLSLQKKIDLIIVGSHGRHGLAALMGSTAKNVIFHAECDVMTVHLRGDQ
ncbi:universal stress protein A [Nitrosomonas sp. Nm51]|uniref:universal stress protein n=1 Tax=Nitrosomonas sp. Nm51 TaxID=133720 RepID=UPI0008D3DE66|nr:universal stress protein [Nitrosomonas sp. Nm51]SEQ78623.1 universal stress protein A [Nitrosomonas sp. Nm51]